MQISTPPAHRPLRARHRRTVRPATRRPRIGDRVVRCADGSGIPGFERLMALTGGQDVEPMMLEGNGVQIWLAEQAVAGAVAFDAVAGAPVTVDFCQGSNVVHQAVVLPGVARQVVTGTDFDRIEIHTDGMAALRGVWHTGAS